MTTIVTRIGKGSPLTNTEMDTNLTNLNSYKVEQDISGNATITGDVYLTGSGKRITGDFSNATVANRVMFQTSTVNSNTAITISPNGTNKRSEVQSWTGSTANESAFTSGIDGSNAITFIASDKIGTGTYLPMTFYTGGLERLRIGTSGQLGLGGSNYGTSGQALTSNGPGAAPTWQSVSGLPSQTGNSGKYLTTNGSSASWATVPQAKAWVNFDGTLTGTITPRSSFNVASITKNATGDYTITFSTAMADANYAMAGFCRGSTFNTPVVPMGGANFSQTTTSIRFQVFGVGGTYVDASVVSLVIFGN